MYSVDHNVIFDHVSDIEPDKSNIYTTFTNFSMEYHLMCRVYTDVGGIK